MALRLSPILLLLAMAMAMVADSFGNAHWGLTNFVGGVTASPACNGLVGECIDEEDEAMMESEVSRRTLAQRRKFISYRALAKNNVPCNHWWSSWLHRKFEKKDLKSLLKQIAAPCWNIWLQRNYKVYQNKTPSVVAGTIYQSLKLVDEAISNQVSQPSYSYEIPRHLSPLPNSSECSFLAMRVQCDGAATLNFIIAAVGISIADNSGRRLAEFSFALQGVSSLLAEAFALRVRVKLASLLGSQDVVVITDAKAIVYLLNSPKEDYPWEIYNLMQAISALIYASTP
ncbi:hypothetical protein HHK36_003678 [Tetracentron sinense]|uniref:RNase H type-1 domain-containing protein n=1 Tax=Tetracentron sinense TaxID=13715 RepID=A0A835DSD7_TETSI|nr:hypothetical protein HHK36_003678 [Tetracentron sinense]